MDPMQSSVRGRRSSLHADAVITIGGVRPAPPPQTSTQHVCQDEAMVSSGDPSWMSGYRYAIQVQQSIELVGSCTSLSDKPNPMIQLHLFVQPKFTN